MEEIEDSLSKLDMLTQEEARMASAELLRIVRTVDDRVEDIGRGVLNVHVGKIPINI